MLQFICVAHLRCVSFHSVCLFAQSFALILSRHQFALTLSTVFAAVAIAAAVFVVVINIVFVLLLVVILLSFEVEKGGYCLNVDIMRRYTHICSMYLMCAFSLRARRRDDFYLFVCACMGEVNERFELVNVYVHMSVRGSKSNGHTHTCALVRYTSLKKLYSVR